MLCAAAARGGRGGCCCGFESCLKPKSSIVVTKWFYASNISLVTRHLLQSEPSVTRPPSTGNFISSSGRCLCPCTSSCVQCAAACSLLHHLLCLRFRVATPGFAVHATPCFVIVGCSSAGRSQGPASPSPIPVRHRRLLPQAHCNDAGANTLAWRVWQFLELKAL